MLIVVAIVIPSLLVGHLAKAWGRDRGIWTVCALLFSWVLALVALLAVGKQDEQRPMA